MGAILFETYKDSFETYTKMGKIIKFFLVAEQMPRDVAFSNYHPIRAFAVYEKRRNHPENQKVR